jgi:hypothetical protein
VLHGQVLQLHLLVSALTISSTENCQSAAGASIIGKMVLRPTLLKHCKVEPEQDGASTS